MRGPKFKTNNVRRTRREEAQAKLPRAQGGDLRGQHGRPHLGGFLTSSRRLGPERRRASGDHAQAGSAAGQPPWARWALGQGRREPALTKLLQLRGHGLGAQGEGRGSELALEAEELGVGAGGRDGGESLAPGMLPAALPEGSGGP